MAKRASRDLDLTYNSVALEDELESLTLNVPQEQLVVTAFSDAGPRVVTGNYNWTVDIGGFSDFDASQGDATLFGQIGDTDGAAIDIEPTGANAGANDPNYTGTANLASYTLSFATGQPAKYTATLQGNSALTRAVA